MTDVIHSADSPLAPGGRWAPGGTPPVPRAASPLASLGILLRYRYLVFGLPLLVGLLVLVVSLLRGPTYVSQSRFAPEGTTSDASRLAGLAAQFGVAIPRSGDRESVDFYAQLVRSEDLLREVALTHYRPAAPGDSLAGTLVDVYRAKGKTPVDRVRRTVDALRKRIGAAIDVKANIVTVSVTAPSAELAARINRRLLDLIASFNLRKRQSRAAAERSFVEGRMSDAQRDLANAEAAQESFLEANRSYRGSPQLEVQAARLQRRVDLRQQVYTGLAQAFEQARIEEVRNTPVITVLDQPEFSTRRSDNKLLQLLLAIFPTFAVSLALAFALDYLRRQREENPEEYASFTALRRAAVSGLVPSPLRRGDAAGAGKR